MFMTIITFSFVGFIFIVLHFIVGQIWSHYVPSSLLSLAIWLKIIQPAWNVDDYQTIVIKADPSAAVFYLRVIAVIYGIVSIIIGNWIQAAMCLISFSLALSMNFTHPH